MFESALNPGYWVGASAVAAPIIIHLINRLRYRRVRWAAIEFLLKSQQRNRRKLILEQLLLLLARCLLVLLVVLLLVRPTWWLGDQAGRAADLPTYHVFLLDDSLSMQDLEAANGPESQNAFREGTRLIAELARKYSETTTTHYGTVLRLSHLAVPELGRPHAQLGGAPPGAQLTSEEVSRLRAKLEALECSYRPLKPYLGVQEAQRYLENVKEGNKYLHLIGDFRRRDWAESDADSVCQLLAEMAKGAKVEVRLHDMAFPRRGGNEQEVPRSHANLGIVNLVARSRPRGEAAARSSEDQAVPVRVVTPGVPVYLSAAVRNFSDIERTGLRLSIKVDGVEKNEFARILDRVSGGEEKVVDFDIHFTEQDRLGLKQISIRIDDAEKKDHLLPDNVRYTYLELRKEIPVLLVDPEWAGSASTSGSFYVSTALTGNPRFGLKPERIRPGEVKNKKLNDYSVVFLINVPGVGGGAGDLDSEGLRALEDYVFRGGSVVFFLGPNVNVVEYNKQFWKDGQGIFPVPLSSRPEPEKGTNQAFVDDSPDPEDQSPKLRFQRLDHPMFSFPGFEGDVAQQFASYSTINRYFKADPTWKPPENVSVVVRLANRRPLTFYRTEAADVVRELNRDSSRFASKLKEYARKIDDWMNGAEQKRARKGPLIEAVAGLLGDPALGSYWAEGGRQELRQRLERFHATLTAGDPLLVEAALGQGKVKGHVMAFLTSAAPTPIRGRDYSWNNWANEMFPTYVPMLLYLHGHMAALSRAAGEMEINRLIGTDQDIRLDKTRFDPRLQLWFHKEGQEELVKVDDITGREEGEFLVAQIHPSRGPGHYLLKLNQPPADGSYVPRGEPRDWPMAFNVDSRMEGALARVAEAEVKEKMAAGLQKGTLKLSLEEARGFVDSRSWFPTSLDTGGGFVPSRSWSDYSWVLLVFVAILLFEQWLAVKFSHHLAESKTAAPSTLVTRTRSAAVAEEAAVR